MFAHDTIAAISSATGVAARMILRLSGPDAGRIAAVLCDGGEWAGPEPARTGVYRCAIGMGRVSVPAWLYLFQQPRSYTGQDIAEFHIPGNPLLARMLLERMVRAGARAAEAGEFTARAFFNGRMDLSQAEGVAATIAAQGQRELTAARQLMAGELSRILRPFMDELARLLSLVEAGIDFAEEQITLLADPELLAGVAGIADELHRLLTNSVRFERLSHEPRFVLVGRPNAGKSTLLNALAGWQRAVVSSTAGTTRDVLEADVMLDRGRVHLVDVAGLEDPPPGPAHTTNLVDSDIPRQMARRALQAVAESDFVLLVHQAGDQRPQPTLPRPADLVILSKADLPAADQFSPAGALPVSARTGLNLPQLRARLSEMAFGGQEAPGGAVLALNGRHRLAITQALDALEHVGQGSENGPEIRALWMREALDYLGQVLGQVAPEDILTRIFSTFCIGK